MPKNQQLSEKFYPIHDNTKQKHYRKHKNASPEISIIIPHHKDFYRLERLVSTVPNRSDLELIVVDDYSEDQARIRQFVSNNPEVIFLENNSGSRGAGTARNYGLEKARGRWVIFADSDDVFITRGLENLMSILYSDNKHEIIFFYLMSRNEKDETVSDRHMHYNKMLESYIKYGCETDLRVKWTSPWGKAYRRDFLIFNKLFFSSHIASNDVLFSCKAGILADRICAIPETVYCISERSGSLTSELSKEKAFARMDVVAIKNWLLIKNRKTGMTHYGFYYFIKSLSVKHIVDSPLCYLRYILILMFLLIVSMFEKCRRCLTRIPRHSQR